MPIVTVFADPKKLSCHQTIEALGRAGLQVQVISNRASPAFILAAGITEFPTVIALTAVGRIRWSGYRADLITLLTDLIETGPVPAHGLDRLENAEQAVITRAQAEHVIAKHQIAPGAFFEECGDQPLYRGLTVLHWLGY